MRPPRRRLVRLLDSSRPRTLIEQIQAAVSQRWRNHQVPSGVPVACQAFVFGSEKQMNANA
jgi:hypothetical protein